MDPIQGNPTDPKQDQSVPSVPTDQPIPEPATETPAETPAEAPVAEETPATEQGGDQNPTGDVPAM